MLTQKDKYDLTKEMLLHKFNGKCALCGDKLSKIWHVWNIKPVKTIIRHDGELVIGDESYENKLPACISCNMTRIHNSHSKHDLIDIEQFRNALMYEFDYLSSLTYFKKAMRYGIIKQVSKEIIFYFENKFNPH